MIKGTSAVDYIQSVPEPDGTEMPLAAATKNSQGDEFSLENLPKPGPAKKKKTN